MGTTTTNYSLYLPTPNSPLDANNWGTNLNTLTFTAVDTQLFNIAVQNIGSSAPALPISGVTPSAGQSWINNTTSGSWLVQLYDGASWLTTGIIDNVNHTYTPSGIVVGVKVTVYSTPGAYTYTPVAGMDFCIVECIGGGGAGGGSSASYTTSAGAGGGGGGYCKALFSAAQISGSQSGVVGTGGAGAAGSAGANGTATTFGSFITANGGTGGNFTFIVSFNAPLLPLAGGAGAVGGTINTGTSIINQAGQSGGVIFQANGIISGAGASTIYGIGGASVVVVTSTAVAGNAGTLGAGGSGAVASTTTTSLAGGAGGNGVVIITEYF